MNCLKCGKETQQEQVFCSRCLDSMAAYPVKPGTAVHLPKQTAAPVQKKALRKRSLNQDERISQLKKWNLWLAAAAAVLVLALALTIGALMRTCQALEQARNTGKNYSVETTPGE